VPEPPPESPPAPALPPPVPARWSTAASAGWLLPPVPMDPPLPPLPPPLLEPPVPEVPPEAIEPPLPVAPPDPVFPPDPPLPLARPPVEVPPPPFWASRDGMHPSRMTTDRNMPDRLRRIETLLLPCDGLEAVGKAFLHRLGKKNGFSRAPHHLSRRLAQKRSWIS